MFKKGTKQGWGQESGGGTGCHAKTEVLGGRCVGAWVRGCVWEGGGCSSHSNNVEKMRDGDTVQVQGMQEKENHRGGCVGVVRWYRTITGVGGEGSGWCWWTRGGAGEVVKHGAIFLLTNNLVTNFKQRPRWPFILS